MILASDYAVPVDGSFCHAGGEVFPVTQCAQIQREELASPARGQQWLQWDRSMQGGPLFPCFEDREQGLEHPFVGVQGKPRCHQRHGRLRRLVVRPGVFTQPPQVHGLIVTQPDQSSD